MIWGGLLFQVKIIVSPPRLSNNNDRDNDQHTCDRIDQGVSYFVSLRYVHLHFLLVLKYKDRNFF
jgi:hypothetical protein